MNKSDQQMKKWVIQFAGKYINIDQLVFWPLRDWIFLISDRIFQLKELIFQQGKDRIQVPGLQQLVAYRKKGQAAPGLHTTL